ncbi:hypothetical protein BC941DRAFT_409939 [Chlamydoabsidia padenii]|nr:hypothetical protein BC941DRAFT_409939 [Chlamydoabsidia padenii]
MDDILTFEAVGRPITFYLVKLLADGLYIIYELRSFTVPGSIDQILVLTGYFDEMYYALNVYLTHCIQMSSEQVNESMRILTLPTLSQKP